MLTTRRTALGPPAREGPGLGILVAEQRGPLRWVSIAYFSALAMPLWVHAIILMRCFLIAGGSCRGISP